MEKAYDVKELVVKFKNQGLEVGEELAKLIVGETFNWLSESADVSENKIDDLLKVLYPTAKAYALEQADKINKEDNKPA